MRIMQTLGRHKAKDQEGIFQYRRDTHGVLIDFSVGRANTLPMVRITVSVADWQQLLAAFAAAQASHFRLTRANAKKAPPLASVYATIKSALPKPGGASWHDSYAAAIAAILEHEGSLDLYGGILQRGIGCSIVLAKDV